MAYAEHQQSASDISAKCAVVTLSDTRTEETDTSGQRIQSMLEDAGHQVCSYQICRDEPAEFEPILLAMLVRNDIDVILTNGGTGVSGRDQTVGVVERVLDQALPGFGELFRSLSYAQIGSGAMLSRAA